MPSGFTSKLFDGEQSFEEFALRCAKGIDFLSGFDDLDQSIPEVIEVDSSLSRQIERYEEQLADVEKWTNDYAAELAKEEYDAKIEEFHREALQRGPAFKRYIAMMREVSGWTPPTNLHVRLKKFMWEKLLEGLECDCNCFAPPRCMTGEQYRAQRIESLRASIILAQGSLQSEMVRVAETNQWLSKLRESL